MEKKLPTKKRQQMWVKDKVEPLLFDGVEKSKRHEREMILR